MQTWFPILEYAGIFLGIVLALWGLFHQLIVGSVVSMLQNEEGPVVRLLVVAWVAHGAFLSFCGLLPSLLLFFHGAHYAPVQTAMLLSAAALLILSIHTYISGFATHPRPLRISFYLGMAYSFYLFLFVIVSHPSL